MTFHKWFTPHRDTHKKAHLISIKALAIYLLLFLLLQASFSVINFVKPGILGISSDIQKEKVIELTNIERGKLGLSPLTENEALSQAALLKAQNMFEEGYWAHFAPSGKSPWDFILGSGYKFSFAGENLAKNFSDNQGVMSAWMASLSHKENIVNSKYKDIGVAVLSGNLNGQETVLVVQMFGTTTGLASLPVVNTGGQSRTLTSAEVNTATLVKAVEAVQLRSSIIDPYQLSKSVGLGLVILVTLLLAVDFIVLKRRGVFRVTSHHLAHMAILSVAAAALVSSSPGSIL